MVIRVVVAVDDDGHAGQLGGLGASDDQRVDVVAASGKHARHVGQDAWFVHHKSRNHMPHGVS
jgi:hypothetical protein